MSTQSNTITIHLNSNDPQWLPEGSDFGWDHLHSEGCEDDTRRAVPQQGEVSELPWSASGRSPLSNMHGVRFEPLGGLNQADFVKPYYDWGIRAVLLGKVETDSARTLPSGDRNTLDILFDSAESRTTFLDVFTSKIDIRRRGFDSNRNEFIDESQEYTLISNDVSGFESAAWGTQDLFFLSVQDPASGALPSGFEPVVSNSVEDNEVLTTSYILDIVFTNSTVFDIDPLSDIMGSCDEQELDPCKPVAPGECEVDNDCIGCNSRCVSGTCVCEDCECHKVCYRAPVEEDFSDFLDPIPREGLVSDDPENCVSCVSPVPGVETAFCECITPTDNRICRPERGTSVGNSCDCLPNHTCCGPDAQGVYRCCLVGSSNGQGTPFQACLDTDEFFDPGDGNDPIRIRECTTITCINDGDCGNECEECIDNQCTPKADETPCGTDDPQCNHCIGGNCVSTGISDCNCDGNECPDGFECCPEGHCCETALGGCDGAGCFECDDDADCVALNGPCSTCTPNGCTIVDCDPCDELNPVTCNCDPRCTGCTSICDDDDPDNVTCLDTCEVCEDCTVQVDTDGNEVGVCSGGPPNCSACQTTDLENCVCVGGCGDCQICNAGVCETDTAACGCCDDCTFVDTGGGQGFWGCSSPDSSKCPDIDGVPHQCISSGGNCSCVPIGCFPPCEGCLTCLTFGNTSICVTPQQATAIGIPTPDPCEALCQTCEARPAPEDHIGDCVGDTCPLGDCCDDGLCCPTGQKCCNDGVDGRGDPAIYCCLENESCCNDGTCCPALSFCCPDGGCCPTGQVCCGDQCCDPLSCQECGPNDKCVSTLGPCQTCNFGIPTDDCDPLKCEECEGEECIDQCTKLDCHTCVSGTCVPDCNPLDCLTCVDGDCVTNCPPCFECDGAGTCIGGCPECEECVGGGCVPIANPCDCGDAIGCAANNCVPPVDENGVSICESECECSNGSNNPCTCNLPGPIGGLVECICGEDPPSGELGCCCQGQSSSQQTRADCQSVGGSWTAGDCPIINPCGSLGGQVGF